MNLHDNPDRLLRVAAIRALPDEVSESVRAELRATLDSSPDAYIREAAAQTLGRLHDAAAIDVLIRACSDSRGRVRDSAVAAIGLLADPAGVTALVERLEDEHEAIRTSAVEALMILAAAGDPHAQATLAEM